MKSLIQRNGDGRFGAGTIANPGGRPKKTDGERTAEALAKQMAPAAMRKLIAMIESPSTSESARLRAIELLLDRALGKPSARADDPGEGRTFVIQQLVSNPPAGGFPGVLCHPDPRWVAQRVPADLAPAEVIESGPPFALR